MCDCVCRISSRSLTTRLPEIPNDRHAHSSSPEGADQLEACHLRHGEISHDEVDSPLTQGAQASNTIACLAHLVPGTHERTSDHLADEVVVIYDENPRHCLAAVVVAGVGSILACWREPWQH
jgi:hypothetical protein